MTRRLKRKIGRSVRNSEALSKYEMLLGAELTDVISNRPKIRADCQDGCRPCPYVSCKYHLYLDVDPHTGSLRVNFPNKDPWELEETCSLDVADRHGITLEEVGLLTNITRERVRQVESQAVEKLSDVILKEDI